MSFELCEFVGAPAGSKLARTEVTRFINKYINDNNLIDGKYINPDEKLKALLKYDDTKFDKDSPNRLSYFNIQKYLSVHFNKD